MAFKIIDLWALRAGPVKFYSSTKRRNSKVNPKIPNFKVKDRFSFSRELTC